LGAIECNPPNYLRNVSFWHIASFRSGAEFGRYRCTADIGKARTNEARLRQKCCEFGVQFAASLLSFETTQPGPSLQTILESQLYPKYTMAEEREIHRAFCQRLGWDSPAINLPTTPDSDADDVLFF
jgi:hypothetical protein